MEGNITGQTTDGPRHVEMSVMQHGASALRILRAGQFLAIFLFCYLYVFLRVKSHLIFHVQEPVFYYGWTFFWEYFQVPGGIASYAAAFLGQAFAIEWIGSTVLASIIVGIGLSSQVYVGVVTNQRLYIVTYIPIILLLVLHNRYQYDLAYDLSLLVAIIGATTFARLGPNIRPVFLIIASLCVYWISGGGLVQFCLLVAIHETINRRYFYILPCIAMGIFLPWVAMYTIYPGSLHQAYLNLLPITGSYLNYEAKYGFAAAILYLFLPVITLFNACDPEVTRKMNRRFWSSLNLALILIGTFMIYRTFDANYRTMLEIDHQARQQNWNAVLSLVPDLTAYDALTVYNVQLALCHKGRLAKDLFSYPHLENQPIFLPSPETPSRLLAIGDYLIELGYINKAEHLLQEALEIRGQRSSILRRLVTVNVLKDRPVAARVYLRILNRSPLDHAWSQKYLARLDADPRQESNHELAKIRKVMVMDDYPGFFSTEDILHQCLNQNPNNLFAFKLLMGHYLQTAQPEKIVHNIGRRLAPFANAFPGNTLPSLYEEAVMLWATQFRMETGNAPRLSLHGRQISKKTQLRYDKFSQILNANRSSSGEAKSALAQDYRNSFWYYYLYRNSPYSSPGAPIITRATRPV